MRLRAPSAAHARSEELAASNRQHDEARAQFAVVNARLSSTEFNLQTVTQTLAVGELVNTRLIRENRAYRSIIKNN